MQFYTVEIKPFKNLFWSFIVFYIAAIIVSLVIVRTGFYYMTNLIYITRLKWFFIFGSFFLSMIISNFQQKKKEEIGQLTDFDDKVKAYRSLYRQKLIWNFLVGTSALGLFILTSRWIFLWLAIIYLAYVLLFFPRKSAIQKELDNEDIVFV